ncbi:MAG TPA: TetR/AcrR family transcriptional regulator [Kofleriaceae bacterium]|jgi:AcrR family transcriptional regulator
MKSVRRELAGRVLRRPGVDKFDERRSELARAALETLSELGYARTGLREIAKASGFSHGVLHYYFADKYELIIFCVRQYKAVCVKRYDEVVESAKTAAQLRKGFAAAMVATLEADAAMHRLWYDVRTQSLFEAHFQADVAEIDGSLRRMVWRIVTEYARLSGKRPAVDADFAYALFDGVFEHALLKHLYGDPQAGAQLSTHVMRLLEGPVLRK